MKKTILSLSLIAALFLGACSKDETTTPDNNNGSGSTSAGVSFKLDGTLIQADSSYAVLYTFGIPPYNRKMDLYAFKGGVNVLEAHFDPKTGTQNMGDSMSTAQFTYKSGNSLEDIYHSSTGTCNFSECDTTAGKLTGTFSLIGKQFMGGTAQKSITEGNIKITKMKVQ